MNNIAILLSENHKYYEELINTDLPTILVDPVSIDETDYTKLEDADTLFDFTCFPRESKIELLLKIGDIFRGNLLSDLSVNWVDFFLEEFDFIDGAMATGFYSPNKTFEVYLRDPSIMSVVEKLFGNFGFTPKLIKSPGICFNYPRILSTIINEAYFAKEEQLATDDDIDKAMRFGVNYPLGPFEWAQHIGLEKVAMVLLELYQATGDQRYRMSHYIKREVL